MSARPQVEDTECSARQVSVLPKASDSLLTQQGSQCLPPRVVERLAHICQMQGRQQSRNKQYLQLMCTKEPKFFAHKLVILTILLWIDDTSLPWHRLEIWGTEKFSNLLEVALAGNWQNQGIDPGYFDSRTRAVNNNNTQFSTNYLDLQVICCTILCLVPMLNLVNS